MLKVMLLDNEPLFATGLRIILEAIPDQKVVGIVNNVDRIEDDCMDYKPDVIFMRDFLFYKNDGFTAAAKVKKSFPEIKIIMVVNFPKAALIKEAQLHGVDSCLLASDEPALYHTCLWDTMKGKHIYPEINDNKWGTSKIGLTDRELDIIRLTCRNMTYEQMADNLGVAKRTISFHVSNILHKTGHKNITGLVLEAAHKGFLTDWAGTLN